MFATLVSTLADNDQLPLPVNDQSRTRRFSRWLGATKVVSGRLPLPVNNQLLLPVNGQLPSPRSPAGGYPPQRDPIDEFFDVTKVGKYAEQLDVDDCLHYMLNFVKREQLDSIVGDGLDDECLIRKFRPRAEIAAQLPLSLNINQQLAFSLGVMGLYNLAVLIGGCIFCGHFHIPTLENKS